MKLQKLTEGDSEEQDRPYKMGGNCVTRTILSVVEKHAMLTGKQEDLSCFQPTIVIYRCF